MPAMPSTFDFCLPSPGKAVPSGPDWLHEIKYDGFRVRLERDGDRVRLFTRNGHDWTDPTPAALSPLRRQNPREEPGALAAHAGICTGCALQAR
jgi:ATP-dependent DNA ligase